MLSPYNYSPTTWNTTYIIDKSSNFYEYVFVKRALK